MRIKARRFFLWLSLAVAATLVAIVILLLRQFDANKLGSDFNQRTPGELIRYARIRLIGHELLEPILLPALAYAESKVERVVPSGRLANLGKGQQSHTLPPIRYDAKGQPIAVTPEAARSAEIQAGSSWSELRVSTTEELAKAMLTAKPGQTILLNPGRYRIAEPLSTNNAGQQDLPITVRARLPGQVRLESSAAEIFKVTQPFWVFENLHLRGVCPQPSDCKHAWLVLGGARSTVLRNNLIEDFNSHLQVNGDDAQWPDEGLVQFNTFGNSRPRDTAMMVAPINIIGASKWRLADNNISNFVKAGGGQSSFGILIRGAGHGSRVERNLLVCTPQQISQPGIRTGISFGGSGSDPQFCREQRCETEQNAGVVLNNVVAHCNDFAIDLSRSASMLLAHNTLINSAGIDVRGALSSATIYGNLLDGRIRERDGAQIKASMNEVLKLSDYLEDADALQLNWRRPVEAIPSLALASDDFCGAPRHSATRPGALAEAMASCIKANKSSTETAP
ncbi:right-handed parallel beta-helix repeat-containing protein [Paucibacter sp. AS339]|uniref:right-handed parallel beta-helix repeat-containing protein n=1 Tax=Paucibacter hankyongi TaxID=3133434 RepID=UPI0030ADABC8